MKERIFTTLGVFAFCFAAWAGIFWLIGHGWGWHLLVVVCLLTLALLIHEPETYTTEAAEKLRC